MMSYQFMAGLINFSDHEAEDRYTQFRESREFGCDGFGAEWRNEMQEKTTSLSLEDIFASKYEDESVDTGSDLVGQYQEQVASSSHFNRMADQSVSQTKDSISRSLACCENDTSEAPDFNSLEPVDQDKPQVQLKLTKRPPQHCTQDNDTEDTEDCHMYQIGISKKKSFVYQVSLDPNNARELTGTISAQWPNTDQNRIKLLGRLRDCIHSIFLDHNFVHPQKEQPFIAVILHQLYSTILPNYNHRNPTATDQRAAQHNLVLMEMKRSDQYVKKFWSKLKVIIYSKFKTESNKRADAFSQITEKFGFKTEDTITFENLFGKDVKHGLKKTTIEFILTRPKLFKDIFNNKTFETACNQMATGTSQDCETNILNKIESLCDNSGADQQKSLLDYLDDQISVERKFKKPFSCMENNLAALQFLDKFIKRIEKLKNLKADARTEFNNKLSQLKKDLETTAKNNKWVPPFKHKKAEIISFLRVKNL